jgi:hypothetical protein
MRISRFLTLKAVICVFFGIALVAAPSPLASLYGIELELSDRLFPQLLGVDILGIGLVSWVARSFSDRNAVLDTILALFIADAIGSVVIVLNQLSGALSDLGWVNVAIWLFLTLGLGYYRFIKPKEFEHGFKKIRSEES